MQINEGSSGSPVPPESSKKEDMELPAEIVDPSDLEEKEPVMQLGAGGEKKRILFDLNAEPDEKRIAFDLNVESDEITAEDMLGHSSERGENDEAAENYERLEERTLQLFSDNKPTRTDNNQNTPTTQLQKELTDFMNYWLAEIGEIQELEDESDHPEHVVRHVALFLTETGKRIQELSKAITDEFANFFPEDFYVTQQKMESANIAALRLKNTCIRFCREKNHGKDARCQESLEQLKEEYLLVKSKLETLFL